MFNEYNAIKLKKERQKINSIKFTFSQFKYDDIVIYSNYSVIYKNTSDTKYGKSIFERVIDSFKWQWDTPNVISLTIYVTIFFDLIRQSKKFIKKGMSIKSKGTLEEESAMLKCIYNMLFDFNKDFDTKLLLSEEAYQEVKETYPKHNSFEATLKGKTGQHKLYEIL